MISIPSIELFNKAINEDKAVLFYFSNDACSVCKVLKPKVERLIQEQFPAVKLYYIDTNITPEISAQYGIFSIPTVLLFFAGKETYRLSRNFGINELSDIISRPYSLLFT
ncbi:MAG TPA: thioredoxin family protein [Candidatus Kapabacteria bacterium]|nr:thioredoxin family protein [Candidatus Kapabacteria bacterium]